jgi:hypothetical protein
VNVSPAARLRSILLLAILAALAAPAVATGDPLAQEPPVKQQRVAVLVLLPPASFEEAMSVPEIRSLARLGGAGLMTTNPEPGFLSLSAGATGDAAESRPLLAEALPAGSAVCVLTPLPAEVVSLFAQGNSRCAQSPRALVVVGSDDGTVAGAGRALRRALPQLGSARIQVVAVSPSPSAAMRQAGDEVTPIVVAAGRAHELLRPSGPLATLWSDTTRQAGLISNVDVAPTILSFLGAPVPSTMEGSRIRTMDGELPFDLHRLHLDQRRTRLPVQMAELAFLVMAAVIGVMALASPGRREELSVGARAAGRVVALSAVALPVALLAAGAYPNRTSAWIVPAVIITVVVLTAMALRLSRLDPFHPFVFLGGVALVLLAIEVTVQGAAVRVPLFGGTMFDGVRFYGLPNALLPFLLGSAVFVAAGLPPRHGFALLVGAGLFAGFPSLGADVGGAVTLFVAAGLWWVLRTRHRVRWMEVAMIAGVAVSGLIVVLLANRFLAPSPTHATRFVESSQGIVAQTFDVTADRLAVGLGMIADVPAAVLPLIGFVVILILVARRVGPVGHAMALDERWPHIVVTLCVAGLVAFVVNDTGAAAADPVFLYAMAAIVYPAMLATGWPGSKHRRKEGPERTPDVSRVGG